MPPPTPDTLQPPTSSPEGGRSPLQLPQRGESRADASSRLKKDNNRNKKNRNNRRKIGRIGIKIEEIEIIEE